MAYLLDEDEAAYVADQDEPVFAYADFEAPCDCGCGYMIEVDDYVWYDESIGGWILDTHPDEG
jgi:hypothetical protein